MVCVVDWRLSLQLQQFYFACEARARRLALNLEASMRYVCFSVVCAAYVCLDTCFCSPHVTHYSEAEAIQTELVEGLCGNDHAVVALICLSYCSSPDD
jgi:hypothetical protein